MIKKETLLVDFEKLKDHVIKVIAIAEKATAHMEQPMISKIIQAYGKNPFLILISSLLSLRAKDSTTFLVCKELFKLAKTPQELLKIPIDQLEQLIFATGFYKRKAHLLHQVSKDLIERFDSKVPSTEEELLSIKGVGRKTANLVLGQAFSIPAICVDTHVHRISNRLGWVSTKSPQETEIELKKIVPQDKWIKINHLLVSWGQNICVPISPFCSRCPLSPLCPKIGVKKKR